MEIEIEKNCKYCGKELQGRKKIFCSLKCNQNWGYKNNSKYRERIKENMRKRYLRIKDNIGYKTKQRENFKKWKEKHLEKWQEENRIINRNFQAKIQKERKEKNVCYHCAGEIIPKFKITKKGRTFFFKTCQKCRDKLNAKIQRIRVNKNKKV